MGIADLIPDDRNGNDGSAYGQQLLETSIQENGLGRGILLDKNGRIIAGNKTHGKAGELGFEKVIVVQTTGNELVATQRMDLDLDDPKARALAWADNRVAQVDYVPNLSLLLEDIDNGVPIEQYFSQEELDRYRELAKQADGQDDQGGQKRSPREPGEEIKESRFKPGSIWKVGEQVMICGDCRDRQSWEWLYKNKIQLNVVFFSPPYASQREYDPESGFKPVPYDEYIRWFQPIPANFKPLLAADGSYFLNIKEDVEEGQRHPYVYRLLLHHIDFGGWKWKEQFACVHGGTPARVWYNFKNGWEPVFQFCKHREIKIFPDAVAVFSDNVPQGGGGNVSTLQGTGATFEDVEVGEGMAYPSNVWKFYKNREALGHDAAFAPELPEQFIKAFSEKGDWVCDPFLGSGSTLIASHRNNRKGVGIEISPLHCERSLRRLEAEIGQDAEEIKWR